MNRDKIIARLQQHYDFLVNQGHEVVGVFLQGSQNYGLDLYTSEYVSDIDSKAIILPSFDDFVYNKKAFSYTYILDNEEHIDTKDIRVMCEMWKKENISYIELLYTDFKIINPEYYNIINALLEYKDKIVDINKNQFLRCIAGMAMEKRKALTHPYPTIMEKINKFGYDPKQLHHLARLKEFIQRYTSGEPIKECYKTKQKEYLLNLKLGKDQNGILLPLEEAERLADKFNNEVKTIKDNNCTEEDIIDNFGIAFLGETSYELLKKKFKKDLKNT
jgi:hypothetical protein